MPTGRRLGARRRITYSRVRRNFVEGERLIRHFIRPMVALGRYFAGLNSGRVILWCYGIWYSVNVWNHFDLRPRLWLTSLGLSMIIGIALVISTRSSTRGRTELDRWQIFRLFLMPFCVSSFSALVKEAGYFLVFPPTLRENVIGAFLIAAFVLAVFLLKRVEKGESKS